MVTWKIIHADVRDGLATIAPGSVQTCITSPPYYALRNYGVEGQIGLEETPLDYVSALVETFEAVKRVLRDDGTLWLNLGDSFAGSGKGVGHGAIQKGAKAWQEDNVPGNSSGWKNLGIKPKDLIGIPWMVALALRSAGWYLRSDIVWHKSAPIPESVRDRPTRAHEFIFLMSKSSRYFYDYEAVRQPLKVPLARGIKFGGTKHAGHNGNPNYSGNEYNAADLDGANLRDVWTVSTRSYDSIHLATFPPDLIKPCVLAGAPADSIVLDCFSGLATTGVVALRHGRSYIGVELNEQYVSASRLRLRGDAPLFNIAAETAPEVTRNAEDRQEAFILS